MATTYTTSAYNDAAVAFPTSGVHFVRVKHTTTAALSQAAADVLKICKLPKGAAILPELCSVFAADDPGGAGATVTMKLTDGTTTKTIIGATTFDAANTRVTAAAAAICALGFYKTGNDDFYVYLQSGTADISSSVTLYAVVAYTMDTGRSDLTT